MLLKKIMPARFQKAEKALKVDPIVSPEVVLPNPYFDARREWNERYGDYIARAKNWRLMAILSGLTALAAVVGLGFSASQNKIVPYVVEVDALGNAAAIKPALRASAVDERVIRAYLSRFINDFRMVTLDVAQQKNAFHRVYSMLPQGAASVVKVNEFYQEQTPFEKAKTSTVTTDITSVLPLTDQTWQVEWLETQRNLQGMLQGIPRHYKASIAIATNPPTDEKLMLLNPLGIYVTAINWTQVL